MNKDDFQHTAAVLKALRQRNREINERLSFIDTIPMKKRTKATWDEYEALCNEQHSIRSTVAQLAHYIETFTVWHFESMCM